MKNFSVYHDYEELYLFLRCINNKPVGSLCTKERFLLI